MLLRRPSGIDRIEENQFGRHNLADLANFQLPNCHSLGLNTITSSR